jgi:protease-4
MERFATGCALLAALLLAACIHINVGTSRRAELVEKVVYGTKGPKILLIDIDGMISELAQPRAFGFGERESMVSRVREQLDRAEEDESIRAIILRINSPGGTAAASEIVYSEIRRFKEEQEIPVIAQLMGVAASGGYYLAMSADTVRALPTTITGSIGVIFSGVSFSGLMEKIGIENQTLTSGPYKDAGSSLRRMTEDERAQLSGVLDSLYARFLEVVEAGRPDLSGEEIRRLADGRIFSAAQAEANGLVDAIGDLPGAVEMAEARAGIETSRVVVYGRSHEWRENLYSMNTAPAPTVSPWALLGPVSEPTFLYLWWPGARLH